MAVLNKFNCFTVDVLSGKHNFPSHTCKVALTDTVPVATNTVLTDIVQIGAGNGYSTGGLTATFVSLTEAAGVAKLVLDDVTFAASGGNIGPFRYAVLYNSNGTTPLIGWTDIGVSFTLIDGSTYKWDANQTSGLLTLT